MLSALSTERLARGSAAHPKTVVLLWVVVLVIAGGLAGTLFAETVTTEVKILTSTESIRAQELLGERLDVTDVITDIALVRSAKLQVDDESYRQVVEEIASSFTALGPDVVTAAPTYYDTNDEFQVSQDLRSTLIPVVLAGETGDAEKNIAEVHEKIEAMDLPEGFELFITGEATLAREFTVGAQHDLEKGEAFGVPIALVILALVFGAVAAAIVPIVLAIVAIVVAIGLVSVIGLAVDMNLFVQNIITMIGLAVGIDYSLFIVSRYREERIRGLEIDDAIGVAGATASRAVLFSGLTVIFALAGLMIVPMNIFISIAIGAITVVLSAVLAGLTLLPAVLKIMGDSVNRFGIWIPGLRKRCEGAKCQDEEHEEGHLSYWDRFARAVMKRPVISLVVTVALLLAAGYSYLDINTGTAGVSTVPDHFLGKQGFDALQTDFGLGGNNPALIVIDGDVGSPGVQDAVARLQASLGADDQFGPAAPLQANDAGDAALLSVPLVGDATSDTTVKAVRRLRDEYEPSAFEGTSAEVLVGGFTAEQIDFFDMALTFQPYVIAFVLALSFVLLMVVFHSIVIPLAAILMNLLSVGAAYGILVLVFQRGVGNDLFGFPQTDVIEAWMPLMLFAILFGLSMDYQVFLLSRIKEQHDKTGDTAESVVYGVGATAGLITGAALIMVAVFAGFAAGDLLPLMQFGFGMAVAVLVDASIIRTIVMPATMKLLDEKNRYLPDFLSWLPEVRIEGPAYEPTPAGGDDD